MDESNAKTQGPQGGTTLRDDLLRLARYRLGGRRSLVATGMLAGAAATAMSWDWLAAAGLIPLLAGALPCFAMCAAGLCAKRLGGRACDSFGAKEPALAKPKASATASSPGATDSVVAQPSEVPATPSPAVATEEKDEPIGAGGASPPAENVHGSAT